MDFGLGEEVEPTGSTSERMWERRVAPGRSSAVTSVGGGCGEPWGRAALGWGLEVQLLLMHQGVWGPVRSPAGCWGGRGPAGAGRAAQCPRSRPDGNLRGAAGLPAACCAGGRGCRKTFCCHLVGKRSSCDAGGDPGGWPSAGASPWPARRYPWFQWTGGPSYLQGPSQAPRGLHGLCWAHLRAYQQITQQICEWGRGTGSVGFLGRGHASASLRTSMLPRQRLTGSSFPLAAPVPSRVCPHCPQTHDRTPRAERPRPVCSLCRGARTLRPGQRVSSLTPGARSQCHETLRF